MDVAGVTMLVPLLTFRTEDPRHKCVREFSQLICSVNKQINDEQKQESRESGHLSEFKQYLLKTSGEPEAMDVEC